MKCRNEHNAYRINSHFLSEKKEIYVEIAEDCLPFICVCLLTFMSQLLRLYAQSNKRTRKKTTLTKERCSNGTFFIETTKKSFVECAG